MRLRIGMRRGFKRLNVQLFATIASVVLLFQLVLVAFLTNYFTDQYQTQTRKLGMDTLENAEYAVSSAFERIQTAAYTLAYNDTMQKYLNITMAQTDYYIVTVQKEVRALMRAFSAQSLPGVHYTLYAASGKRGIVSTLDDSVYINYGYGYEDEPWYQYLEKNPGTRNLFLPNQSVKRLTPHLDAPKHLFIYRVHRSNTLVPNGFLVVQFDGDTFSELIGALPSAIQNVLIVDGAGNTLYEHMSFLTRERLMSDAQAHMGVIRTENGNPYVPLVKTIDGLGWEIACTVDAGAVSESLRAFRDISVLSMLISIFALLFLIYGIARRITRPVARLSAGMENIRLGHYGVSLPVERDDEIGLVTEAFNGMAHQLLNANERLKRYEALQQSISFYALQQQINPHFLYNTLEMIIGMATEKNTGNVILVCECLAALFRYNLSRELTVPLEKEIAHVRNYVTILNLRNARPMDVIFDVDPDMCAIDMPKLVLQPLIENCVKHAASDDLETLSIRVTARHENGNRLHIEIADDGNGFSQNQLLDLNLEFSKKAVNVPHDSIGILNIYARLRLIYSDGFFMRIANGEERGAIVSLSFPTDVPISLV